MYLDNVWHPHLAVTGADGLPPINQAGNVVRKSTSLKLSIRICPAMDPKKALEIITHKLTTDVPYNAKVTVSDPSLGPGFSMKDLSPKLQ